MQRRLRYNANTTRTNNRHQTNNAKHLKPKPKKLHLTFTFVGIHPDNDVGCIQTQLDNIKITSLTIKSKLKPHSTVANLKQFIKRIYSISAKHDVLIIYSHTVISSNTTAKLRNFGITDHSLLTLAISARKNKNNRFNPYTYNHFYDLLKQTKYSAMNERQRGLDIVTQETDAILYKMPFCGHLMSKQSLFYYAMSVFSDPANLYLRCPHTSHNASADTSNDQLQWSCPQCAFIIRARRWSGIRDKCPMCHHEKPKNDSIATKKCNQIWHYSLIKQLFVAQPNNDGDIKDNDDDIDFRKLELLSARNRLESNALNVQKCYNCKTLHFKHSAHKATVRNMSGYKILKTKCVCCKSIFCWNCGKKYKKGHACDGSFILQIMTILETCALKTIGSVANVPSIRACPNKSCRQLITHVTACKHMRCGACKLNFCFVCLRPTVNGMWQCGNSSDRCPVAERQTLELTSFATVHLKKSFSLF